MPVCVAGRVHGVRACAVGVSNGPRVDCLAHIQPWEHMTSHTCTPLAVPSATHGTVGAHSGRTHEV